MSEASREAEKRKISKDGFKTALGVFQYLRPYWLPFSTGLLLIVISGLLVILITSLLGQLVSAGLPGTHADTWTQIIPASENFWNDWGTTGQVLFMLAVLLIVQGVLSFFRVYLFSYVTENAMMKLRMDAYHHIIRMPMAFFHERRIGDLSSRLSSDITVVQETLTITLAELIRQSVIIIFGVGWLVSYSSKLTMVMLITMPVIILVMVLFGRFIKKLGKKTQDKVSDSSVMVNEALTGIVNVKSFTNEAYELDRYFKGISTIRDVAMKSAIWRGMFGTFIIIFLFGALGLVMGVGAHLQSTGELAPEVLGKFVFITGLVAGSIGGLAAQMGAVQRSLGVIESVMLILKENPEPDNNAIKRRPTGSVSFKNVSFQYPSRLDISVLNHVSFDVAKGSQVAIVGSSGAGKSTIAALIQRFYEVTEGEILFDGESSHSYNIAEIRSAIAYVPQEVILFGGSIRENIRYGKPAASDAEVDAAAERANAMQFIHSFPEGMNTLVGERGIQLSGGQRQRIAIARAILRDPALLILDEATSALDSESESWVQSALQDLMKNRTTVVIAHRLSTIRNADLIVVLDKGQIVEQGRHDDLIMKNGYYSKLSSMQNLAV
jgi:ABC-type multidrug transport system fused ATPase/permease subunit